ncbi:YciI family protein [Paracidovorax avenae]|uniref:YciI family protein n=1 Tax=Paracidovorax avenae TaxID=80867 RepID=UPI001E401BFC|nr:YciI family protein [Paracidovorax avenae]
MLFAVLFTDRPDQSDVRAAHLQAHIAWLEQHKEIIPVGGSLRQEMGQTPKGGLWVAEADSKEQIEELLKSDLFLIAGLRQNYEIRIGSKPMQIARRSCDVGRLRRHHPLLERRPRLGLHPAHARRPRPA